MALPYPALNFFYLFVFSMTFSNFDFFVSSLMYICILVFPPLLFCFHSVIFNQSFNYLCAHVCAHSCSITHIEVKGQPEGASSSLHLESFGSPPHIIRLSEKSLTHLGGLSFALVAL